MPQATNASRALVTGGAGFVGSALVRMLLAANFTVTVYDWLKPGRADYVPEGVELIVADIRDEESFRKAVEKTEPDIVFHLAAMHYIPDCDRDPQQAMRVNAEGTEVVIRVADQLKVPRVVFCSTAAVYPPLDVPLSEAAVPPGPMDIYGYTKVFGEDLIRWRQKKSETKFAIARLFNVYGPRETSPHLIPAILKQMIAGVDSIKVGNIEPKRDYVYVDDIAMGLFKLGTTEFPQTCEWPVCANLSTGHEHSVREVLEALQVVTGRSLTLEQDPSRMRASDRPHLCGDNSHLRELVGWAPDRSFMDGLKDLVVWAQANPDQMVG